MIKNEFSRLIEIETLDATETVHDIVASVTERAALAARFDVRGIEALAATFRLRRDSKSAAVHLQGRLVADVTQDCVVTLAPVRTHIDETFTIRFEPGAGDADLGDGEEVRVEDEDLDIEPLDEDRLDIGEIAAEQLALAMPAHPRAEGVQFEMPRGAAERPDGGDRNDGGPGLAAGRVRPFAGLDKRMKTQ